MADITVYRTLEEKAHFFSNEEFFKIDTKEELLRWFEFYFSNFKKERPVDYIFRGMSDAKYKLFTSAQRYWINNNMSEWKAGYTYKDFIEELVSTSKINPLLNRVFELYGYNNDERDFPLLSLLQHYGAPSPLLDWSYNIKCAAFFATDGVKRPFNGGDSIDNYMSVYSIHKKTYQNELISLYDITNEVYPPISAFREIGDEAEPNSNSLFIVSDFEKSTNVNYPHGTLKVFTKKPMTSLYNQNIIPQEGLLMYNPFQDRPIEQLFNVNPNGEGQNLHLSPFKCFNIHKDLSEYLTRLLDVNFGINKSYMYPHLYDDAKSIRESVLNGIVR